MRKFPRKVLALIIPAASGITPMISVAGESPSLMLEEVVVTAQRREQSLQDVPISVSAVNADALKQSGLSGLHDLGNIVAGVKIGNAQSAQSTSSIRGVNSFPFGFGIEDSVPFYLDGVYLGAGYDALGELMDIEQIEVLKGPQGTLFGRNASAGAVSVRTARPNDTRGGSLSVNYGNYDLKNAKVSLNIPVIDDELLVRTGYSQTTRGGWQSNVASGEKDGYEMDRWAAYVRGLWTLSDTVEIDISSDWSRQKDHPGYVRILEASSQFAPLYQGQAALASTVDQGNDYAAGSSGFGVMLPGIGVLGARPADHLESDRQRKIRGTAVKVNWDIDDHTTLTSLTSYRTSFRLLATDGDGSDLGMVNTHTTIDTDEVNQEFRLSVLSDSADWFVGVNAYKQKRNFDFSVSASGLSALGILAPVLDPVFGLGASLPALNNPFNEVNRGENKTTSYAVYGDVIWHLNDAWNVTVGVRYSYGHKNYQQKASDNRSNFADGIGPITGGGIIFPNLDQLENPADVESEKSWNNLSGRLVLDYSPSEETLLYASLSQGYKAGGFNTTRTVSAVGTQFVSPAYTSEPFDEETNLNLEFGVKTTLMDGRMRLNSSVFTYEYKGLQFLMGSDSAPAASTINAEKVTGMGLDLEVMFAATERINLFVNASVLDAEFSENVVDNSGQVRVKKGEDSMFAPHMSGSLGVDYLVPLDDAGELRFNLTYSYTGKHFQLSNDQTQSFRKDIGKSESYAVINGRVSWLSADENWELALWGKNITNESYSTLISNSAAATAGVVTVTPAEPRTYGLNLEYHF